MREKKLHIISLLLIFIIFFIGFPNRRNSLLQLVNLAFGVLLFKGYVFVLLLALITLYMVRYKYKIEKIEYSVIVSFLLLQWIYFELNSEYLAFYNQFAISLLFFKGYIYFKKIDDCDKSFSGFFHYLFFFPSIIAGPVVMPGYFFECLKQLSNIEYNNKKIVSSLSNITEGVISKFLIANFISENLIVLNANMGGMQKLLSLFIFTFQIYFDFYGYCKIGQGIARLIGFELEDNFNSPLGAGSSSQFWSRWNISLGKVLDEFVFLPLVGKSSNAIFALFITFIVSGILHRPTLVFVFWGIWHFVVTLITRITIRLSNRKSYQFLHSIFFLILLSIGWIFFRAKSFNEVVLGIRQLIQWDSSMVFLLGKSSLSEWGWGELDLRFFSINDFYEVIVYIVMFYLIKENSGLVNSLKQKTSIFISVFFSIIIVFIFLAYLRVGGEAAFVYQSF